LLKGAICAEQLMPKNFVFYNPDHHKRIYALLEKKKPAGIIAATEKKPEMVGALYPFPLIVDGDFKASIYWRIHYSIDFMRFYHPISNNHFNSFCSRLALSLSAACNFPRW